jgi:hypothetical protein
MAQLVMGFSWPAALVISAAIGLFIGGLLALNYGTKAPRWFLLPLLLAHLHVFAYGQFGLLAWYPVFALFLLSIVWLVWVCREVLLAGILFAYFLLVYGGAPALLIWFA